jgi:hypothetical protein
MLAPAADLTPRELPVSALSVRLVLEGEQEADRLVLLVLFCLQAQAELVLVLKKPLLI